MQSFIVTLFDSNIETNVKVELLKAYTNKDMGQYELTYLVEYFIRQTIQTNHFIIKLCVFVAQVEINQIALIFLQL